MNSTVEQLSDKLVISKLQFSKWRNAILCNIDFPINKYKDKFQHKKYKPISINISVKKALEKLQHNFVVAPIDKAVNNISFICKRFYITILREH